MSGPASEGGGAPAQSAGAFRVVAGAGIPFLSHPRQARPQAVPGVPARHTGAALLLAKARSHGAACGRASSQGAAGPSGALPPADVRNTSAAPARAEPATAPGEQAAAPGTAAAKAQARAASGAGLPALFTFDGEARPPLPAPISLASLPEEVHPAGLPHRADEASPERDLGSSLPVLPCLAQAAAGGRPHEGQAAEELGREDSQRSLEAGSDGAASAAGSPPPGARDAPRGMHSRKASLKASVSLGDWITPAAAPPRSAAAPCEGPDPTLTLLPAAPPQASGAPTVSQAGADASSAQHVEARTAGDASAAGGSDGLGAGTGTSHSADGGTSPLLLDPGHEPHLCRAGGAGIRESAAMPADGVAGGGAFTAAPPAAAAGGAVTPEAAAAQAPAQGAAASAAAAPPALAPGPAPTDRPRELGAFAPAALAPLQVAAASAPREPAEQLAGSPHAPVSAFAGAGSKPGSEPGRVGEPADASEPLPVAQSGRALPASAVRGAAGAQPAGEGTGLHGAEALERVAPAELLQECTERGSSGLAPAAGRPASGDTDAASAVGSRMQNVSQGLAVAAAPVRATALACNAERTGAEGAALAHERGKALRHPGPAEAAAAAAERSGAQALPAPEAAEPEAEAAEESGARDALPARVDALECALAEAHDAARRPPLLQKVQTTRKIVDLHADSACWWVLAWGCMLPRRCK